MNQIPVIQCRAVYISTDLQPFKPEVLKIATARSASATCQSSISLFTDASDLKLLTAIIDDGRVRHKGDDAVLANYLRTLTVYIISTKHQVLFTI